MHTHKERKKKRKKNTLCFFLLVLHVCITIFYVETLIQCNIVSYFPSLFLLVLIIISFSFLCSWLIALKKTTKNVFILFICTPLFFVLKLHKCKFVNRERERAEKRKKMRNYEWELYEQGNTTALHLFSGLCCCCVYLCG